MLAETMGQALGARGIQCHVAELHSSRTVLAEAVRVSPDLVILDLDLGPIDGLDLVRSLRAAGQRVLVVTGCEDTRRLAAAIALGAVGWIAKARSFDEILQAVESACRDRPLQSQETRDGLANAGRQYIALQGDVMARMDALTPREREILSCIVSGETAEEMADRFVISLGTVRTHIRSVLAKLGVSSQLAAAAVAVEWAASRRGIHPDDLLVPLRTGG